MSLKTIINNLFNLFSSSERNKPKLSLKERYTALKNVPKLFSLIWETSKVLTIGNIVLRILKSLFAPAILYVGKLIIDEAIGAQKNKGQDLSELFFWIAVELGLVILSDVLT